jgi:hypothetical protein
MIRFNIENPDGEKPTVIETDDPEFARRLVEWLLSNKDKKIKPPDFRSDITEK